MIQVVGCRHLTTEARVRTRSSPLRIYGKQVELLQVFSDFLSIFYRGSILIYGLGINIKVLVAAVQKQSHTINMNIMNELILEMI
jgi:hypothetical protein